MSTHPPCVECGLAKPAMEYYPVGTTGHWLCERCRRDVLDVLELAAHLHMSVYDLAAAVVQ